MDDRKFEVIQQLMDELQGMMGPSKEDFASRLGREPEVEIEVAAGEPVDGDEFTMEGDMDSPEEKLKQRVLKMRG